MTKKVLRIAVLGMMRETARNLTDAVFVSYDSVHTGSSDNRTKAQYVMPLSVSHLQHPKMRARALASEKALAEYEGKVRRCQQEALAGKRD